MTTNITSARQIPKPACAYRVQHAGSEHCKSVGQSGGFFRTGENRGCRTSPRQVPCEMARSGSRTVLFRAFFSLKKENTPRRTARRPVRGERKKRVFSAQRQLEKALAGRLRGWRRFFAQSFQQDAGTEQKHSCGLILVQLFAEKENAPAGSSQRFNQCQCRRNGRGYFLRRNRRRNLFFLFWFLLYTELN